ncbi:uncharacterized protein LOC131149543 [Malania oleifera]|uniref:uncharacterized protein LOC131149543 n=1 Tax=Malania oleifera TaxID=397392 RepID=UPI0025AEC93E|nr:uncharacterized protein LOC131149543 [Malania oleifera]
MEWHHQHINSANNKKTSNNHKKKMAAAGAADAEHKLYCSNPCFFCAINETDSFLRRAAIARCFRAMLFTDDRRCHNQVLALSSLWHLAVSHPNHPEFPSLGVFQCMANLIRRSLTDASWLLTHHNIFVPYHAAHIIGSYSMNMPHFAYKAVESGVIPPLMDLLRGKISWVEQRVAVRALGHLASHERTFAAISEHEEEIVKLTIEIASTCLNVVYFSFVGVAEKKRLKYHRELLTRGVGGLEMENRKAEEWASQLQCWSLFLLNCFACKQRCLNLMCKREFLKELCGMWGGLTNRTSPAGIGLIRSLCFTKLGRQSIADSGEVVRRLGNVSRSSDKWQHMAIDSLLLLLKDPETRYKVLDFAVLYLADLVELRNIGRGRARIKVGEAITQTLLSDYCKIKYGNLNLKSKKAEKTLEEVWDLKVERRKREKMMSEKEVTERKKMASVMKKEGNEMFWRGDIKEAAMKYSKALNLCPLKVRRERAVLHSNRAQCHLLLRDPESAISDATRALCLSNVNSRGKSLWRRSQAYDMKGLAKESLMDCLMFVNGRMRGLEQTRGVRIPYYATLTINKQMNATWIFAAAESKARNDRGEIGDQSDGRDQFSDVTVDSKRGFPGKVRNVNSSMFIF